MSPELSRQFESVWPVLARRLYALLARKQVPAGLRDDLVQETALRLYGIWEKVDQSRPHWPLTATIALNLVRDQSRRIDLSCPVAECPELTFVDDVEQIALARVELSRVRSALALMTPEQRSVLLAEIGIANGYAPTSATKMRRHRARRKLRQVLERAIALVVFPARRITDIGQGLLALRESFAKAAPCLACVFVGAGSLIGVPLEAARVDPALADRPSRVASVITPGISSAALVEDAAFLADATESRVSSTRSRDNLETKAGGDGGAGAEGSPSSGSVPTPATGPGIGGTPPIPKQPILETEIGAVDPGDPDPGELPQVPPVPGGQPGEDQAPDVEDAISDVEESLDETGIEVEVVDEGRDL